MLRRIMLAANSGGGSSNQIFSFDPSIKSGLISLTSSNKIATCITGGGHYYAGGTSKKNSGKWQFEIEVVQSSASSDGNILIGLMPVEISPGDTYPGFAQGYGLWTRQNSPLSRIYSGVSDSTYISLTASSSNILQTGSLCTVAVDFEEKLISVYKDGALISSQIVPSILPSSYWYIPSIKLWGSANYPTSVRIPSSITWPVLGYSGWQP